MNMTQRTAEWPQQLRFGERLQPKPRYAMIAIRRTLFEGNVTLGLFSAEHGTDWLSGYPSHHPAAHKICSQPEPLRSFASLPERGPERRQPPIANESHGNGKRHSRLRKQGSKLTSLAMPNVHATRPPLVPA